MNKKKLYDSIMESVSKKLQNILLFDNSNIFNKEESLYDYDEKDSIIFRTIDDKILNNKAITEEESIYYFKINQEIPQIILNRLCSGQNISKVLLKGIIVNNIKYQINSKEELMKIIKNYSKQNPKGSLNWIDTSKITDMRWLFAKTNYKGDISEWDTSNVTDMSYMFYNTKFFNQDISNWDVSNVTTMESMFNEAKKFNQPIGNWNVSNVNNMCGMFYSAHSFNQPIGNWDVRKVTNMRTMFFDAISFNQSIDKWDVSNVLNMNCTFYYAISFNQPLENWNVSNVTDMNNMFSNAFNFNQNISNWKINTIETYKIFDRCPIKDEYKPKIK